MDPTTSPPRVTGVCADLARQLVADAEGASHDIAVEVRVRRDRARGGRGRPVGDPQQPLQGGHLRQGPQLGPGAGGGRHDRRGFDPTQPRRRHQRRPGVPGRRPSATTATLVDLAPREVRVVVDLHAGEATATVWTNDLTHDYVHENSAYSS